MIEIDAIHHNKLKEKEVKGHLLHMLNLEK